MFPQFFKVFASVPLFPLRTPVQLLCLHPCGPRSRPGHPPYRDAAGSNQPVKHVVAAIRCAGGSAQEVGVDAGIGSAASQIPALSS
jgi:hypothetical protein